MPDFRTLELKDDRTLTDYDHVPEQRGEWKALIQPADYLFELPSNLATAWVAFDATVGDEQKQRVGVVFDDAHPLVVVGARDPKLIGETLRLRVTNAERNRARRGDPPAYVSDMLYLLKEGFGFEGKPQRNREWIEAMNACAGKQFVAALEWSVFCNPANTRYVEDETGAAVEDPDKVKGCGARYYLRDIPRDEAGLYAERFSCTGVRDGFECGASLRAFGNLARFRKAESWVK